MARSAQCMIYSVLGFFVVALIFGALMISNQRAVGTVKPLSMQDAINYMTKKLERSTKLTDAFTVTDPGQAIAVIKWDWEKTNDLTCKTVVPAGNWFHCGDPEYKVQPPCLVYSFGIWNDWSFDDAMGKLGCEVHSFDPSIGKNDFNRSAQVHFHNMGIAGEDKDQYEAIHDIYVTKKQLWKIRKLATIMKMLGHEKRVIDVLKIDIETHEWATVKSIVESGLFPQIRQLLVEWHIFPSYPKKELFVDFMKTYYAMKDDGIRLFQKSFHQRHFEVIHLQADVGYVNVKFDKSKLKH